MFGKENAIFVSILLQVQIVVCASGKKKIQIFKITLHISAIMDANQVSLPILLKVWKTSMFRQRSVTYKLSILNLHALCTGIKGLC